MKLSSKAALAASLMVSMGNLQSATILADESLKSLGRAISESPMLFDSPPESKGKRSRRRRAAKLRAKGYKHYGGIGWIHPYSKQGLIESLLRDHS